MPVAELGVFLETAGRRPRHDAILAEHETLADAVESGDLDVLTKGLSGHLTATRIVRTAGN